MLGTYCLTVFLWKYSLGKKKLQGRTAYPFIVDGMLFFIGVGNLIKIFRQDSSIGPENLQIGYYELSKLDDVLDIFDRLSHQGKFSQYEKNHNKKIQPTQKGRG